MPPAVLIYLKIFSKFIYRNIVDGGYTRVIWYLIFLGPVIEVQFKNEVGRFLYWKQLLAIFVQMWLIAFFY